MAFLVVTVPATGLFIRIIIREDANPYYQIILSLICAYEFICIFGVHFLFAKRNSQLQDISKRIMLTSFHHRMSRMNRFKLSLFAQTMFVEKKYGITYGNIGLISMMSFAKVTL